MKEILGGLFGLLALVSGVAALGTLSAWTPGQSDILLGFMTGIGRLLNVAASAGSRWHVSSAETTRPKASVPYSRRRRTG